MSRKDRAPGSQGWPGEKENIEPSAEHVTGAPHDARRQGREQDAGLEYPGLPASGLPGSGGPTAKEHVGWPAMTRKRWWRAVGPRPADQSIPAEPSTDEPKADEPKADERRADERRADEHIADRPGADRPGPVGSRSGPSAEGRRANERTANLRSSGGRGADGRRAGQPTEESGGEDNPGWAIISYLVAGMAVYGGIGWLIGRWTGYSAVLLPVGLLGGLGLALAMIILRYGRS
jgi:ATP synthase protein I